MTLLETQDVSNHFGGAEAAGGVTRGVEAGTIIGLIGPNGTGNTTRGDAICG